MLCTLCSEEVKPIVAFDLDGTLSDYHTTYPDFACDYFNISRIKAPWDGSGEFEEWIGLTKAEYREAKLAYRQGGMKRLQPIFDDVVLLLSETRRAGAEIWLTTTRPWNRYDSTDPDTLHWLGKHGINFDFLLYDDYKYERLAKIVDSERVVGVLEDLPDQYRAAAVAFGPKVPVLIKRRHNEWQRTTEFFEVAEDLKDAIPRIGARIRAWRRAHG